MITSAHLTLFYFLEFCNGRPFYESSGFFLSQILNLVEKRLWASRIQHRINKDAHEMWHMMSKHEASLNVHRRECFITSQDMLAVHIFE